ncbi:MAG: 50S ribosomal L9 C-terminal domain-containing protein [Patescibacteria group bacterium]
MIEELTKTPLIVSRQATAMEHLYDKIDAKDIANELTIRFKTKIDKDYIKLNSKIENL